MQRMALIGVLALSTISTACFGLDNLFGKNPLDPGGSSSTSTRSYLGTWTDATTSLPTAQSCGGAQWKITSQTGNQFSGDFTATCSGGVALAGTIVATAGDSTTIPWAASGNATQGSSSCAFNITGTGTFQGTSTIVINYAGTSCFGPIAGSETVTR